MIYAYNTYQKGGSFNHAFNDSFDKADEYQTIYIPKERDDNSELKLLLKNVSELDYFEFPCKDLGNKKHYYEISIPILFECPSGEYNYKLINSVGDILAEGILQVIGVKGKRLEYGQEITYKEYGRKI